MAYEYRMTRPWHIPDCTEQYNPPGLYLVSTPIGNLGDITIRALDILSLADYVVCEDKRITGKLLKSYGLKKSLILYHDHSNEKDRINIIELIKSNKRIAMVSDAGMPMISDPGHKLIQSCINENLYVTSLPGANASIMALQLSGLPSQHFAFIGFLPNKSNARKNYLQQWKSSPTTLITFENPKRLSRSLKDIHDTLGNRSITIARELTKRHEELQRGITSDLIEHYKNYPAPKGEITIVISPPKDDQKPENKMIRMEMQSALTNMKPKEAAKTIAKKYNIPPSDLYDIALEIKDTVDEKK